VVLLSFGSRFYFDKKLNDLSETIDQKLAQIDTYSEIEVQMRTLLAKQAPVESFLSKSINFESKYNTLTKVVPSGVRFEKVFFDQNTLRLNGKADTELGFAQLLQNLKGMDTLSYLNIKDTNFDQSTKAVMFTIQANYK
jgi:Tfp pilus assembly protein PilN